MPERVPETVSAVPRRLFAATLVTDALFLLAYGALALAGQHGTKLFAVFDLDAEANPVSWWSGAQLLLAGVALIVVASRPLITDARLAPLRRVLLVAGAGLVFLSADETGVIHERITGLLAGLPFVPTIHGNGVWVFVYGALGVALLLLLWRGIVAAWCSCRRECSIAVAGFALMFLGGVAFEVVGYVLRPGVGLSELEVLFEEAGELVGQSVILFAAASLLASAVRSYVARITTGTAEGPGELADDRSA